MSQEHQWQHSLIPIQIYKDSLAFRLLRMHGYRVSPCMNFGQSSFLRTLMEACFTNYIINVFPFAGSFCWFLNHEDILKHMEEDSEHFSSAMYNVYRATDLTFSGEYELQEARSFARNLLEKTLSLGIRDDAVALFPDFYTLVAFDFLQNIHIYWV